MSNDRKRSKTNGTPKLLKNQLVNGKLNQIIQFNIVSLLIKTFFRTFVKRV